LVAITIGYDDKESRVKGNERGNQNLIADNLTSPQKMEHPKKEERAEVLREFTQVISSTLDHKAILRQSLKRLSQVLEFDTASIYLLPHNNQNEFVAGIGYADEILTSREAEKALKTSPIINKMADTLQPVLSGDVSKLEGWKIVQGAEHVRSFMGVPLTKDNKLIGVLMFDSSEYNHFSQSDVEIVLPLAQQMAISIVNARLFEEVQHQLFLSYTLQQVGNLLTTSLSLDEVYEELFDLLSQVIKYDSVTIQLFLSDKDKLEMVAGRGFLDNDETREYLSSIEQHTLRKFNGASRWQLINDTEEDPLWVPIPDSIATIGSWIGAKLVVKDRLIGVLNVDNRAKNAYTKTDAETVAAFANQAAVAIENARLYEETHHRANELEILHEVALKTATLLEVDSLLEQTTQLIVADLDFDSFGFVLVDEMSGRLLVHPSYHGFNSDERDFVLPMDKGIILDVTRTAQFRIVDEGDRQADYFVMSPAANSGVAVPILIGGDVFAVISAESTQFKAFNEYDVRFLQTLALQVASGVERIKLYDALRQHTDHLSNEVARQTAELQSERDRTLAILESAGEGIFLTDLEGTILYVNPAMVKQSGYMRSELLGQNPRILRSDQMPQTLYRDLWQSLKRGETWRGELVNQRKDGRLYDISMTVVPLRDADDQIVNYVSVQSDISRLKEVERLKSKFVSNVSHELRTPLTNITTYLKLLEKGREERREHYLSVLKEETQRLTRLIQDLLDLSQLDTESIADTAVSTDLVMTAKTHFETFSAQAEAKNIDFYWETAADSILVNIEKHHLSQLLTNLLGNAFAYTAEDGTVTLSTGLNDSGEMGWIKIKDSGVGISPGEKPRLFDRFFRGKAAELSGIPGTGLGLAICQEIAERWGGMIEVESEPDQGAQFTVWLPIYTD
jgi:PAS domain S-box-containing protein